MLVAEMRAPGHMYANTRGSPLSRPACTLRPRTLILPAQAVIDGAAGFGSQLTTGCDMWGIATQLGFMETEAFLDMLQQLSPQGDFTSCGEHVSFGAEHKLWKKMGKGGG